MVKNCQKISPMVNTKVVTEFFMHVTSIVESNQVTSHKIVQINLCRHSIDGSCQPNIRIVIALFNVTTSAPL